MNRQLRYPLIFLLAFLFLITGMQAFTADTFTPKLSATLPATVVLLSPSGAIGTNYQPAYTWDEAAGVTWYHLRVSSVNIDGSLSTIYDEWHEKSVICSGAICSVTPALTLIPGNYEWSIQIWNDVEYGTWSGEMNFSTSPQSTTYYVSPNGNDSNPGTLALPYLTINRARDAAVAGDTVYVRGGVYNQVANLNVSGTSTAPIKFLAYPGEVPVIDGNNYTLATGFGALIYINADWVEVSGFEVRYSGGYGILILGKHSTVSNMNVHHSKENGILAQGDYDIVENNLVWSNCMSNLNGVNENGPNSWAAGLSAGQNPHKTTLISAGIVLRNNTVYGNWGEGLSTFGADGTIIEDNIIYDNWSNNAYIMNASNVILQRNLIYSTGALPLAASLPGQAGIVMGDEVLLPKSQNNTVINNLVFGTNQNFYWWKRSTTEYNSYGLTNALIANNTFVNSTSTRAAIVIRDGNHTNSRFVNNIVLQDGNVPIRLTATNLEFSNNIWSDSVNPLLAMLYPVTAGGLAGDWFALMDGSPAIDSALPLREVTVDYFGTVRMLPDIGAIESGFVTLTSDRTITETAPITPSPIVTATPATINFPVFSAKVR